MAGYDVVVRGGTVYDGTGAPPVRADVGIRAGMVAAIGIDLGEGARTIDAAGKWVTPGLIDVHTHYDAEVLFAPGLGESARHGVTSVVFGNCSLSTVYSEAEDCADMFARVEALPWDVVHAAVKEHRDWRDPKSYVAALESRPLGVNVAAFLGHSDIRVAAMGLARASDGKAQATRAERRQMAQMLTEALDAGFVGLSTIRSSFSKLEGKRYPGRQLPSTYASWSEYRELNDLLRERNRIHQSTPNLTSRLEMAHFFLQSARRRGKPLKTTLISAADIKADRAVVRLATTVAALANRALGAEFRWQHLPVPFEVYADGVDLVVFEEFGSGVAALNIRDLLQRHEFLDDPEFRRAFRKDMAKKFGSRVWHRDLHDAEIVACPDGSVIGRSFGEIADERGILPPDALLDLVVQHGSQLRWHTTIANDRDAELNRLARSPHVQMGFADSGAHLRNMAFYNMGVRFLERVHRDGFLPVERAVHRLTGELAQWYGLDTGRIAPGARADIAIFDPAGFDGSSAAYREAPMPGAPGVQRMVNRNDGAVTATIVNGVPVYEKGEFADGFGETLRAGTFLRAVG
ncbi:N-acyl-D-amino-acid deacylase family protein [Nocardia mexicana]|uniref:N-acyl-D-aspartate/D-glutamate deacylase n=1 Tax=Nocardia mexicana TaxID=279262 RepID=A0A370H878_9NOCA|nr:amidohydrolase family protein [Nocardia mexicana]RDI52729.1 N-acyl-D-aspartate/D-glutamate deacylase [Nocardia mexicana]